MMKHHIAALLMLAFFTVTAQVQKEDGTWWDNDLAFKVTDDQMKLKSELEICIYHTTKEKCIENLVTGFEVRIYDASGKELWNSLWTGSQKRIKFKKKFPQASYLVIKATRPFVINELTTNRIYQDKPMELKHTIR
jgi:hypothetical protein